MRSDIAAKAPENRRSRRKTPHNHALRIIGATDVDAVARRGVAGAAGFGDDVNAFGVDAEGDDFAEKLVLRFLRRRFRNMPQSASPQK